MKRDDIKLTNDQIVYLAEQLKAKFLLGMTDNTRILSQEQKQNYRDTTEEQLREKGVIKLAFGGKKTIDQEVEKCIRHCMNCEKYMAYSEEKIGTEIRYNRFYYRDGVWMQAEEKAGLFSFAEVGADVVKQQIEMVQPRGIKQYETDVYLLIPLRDWKEVLRKKRMKDTEAAEEILDRHIVSEKCKKLICNPESKIVSMTIAQNAEEKVNIKTSSIIYDTDYIGEFFETVQDDRTMKGIQEIKNGDWIPMMGVIDKWLTA